MIVRPALRFVPLLVAAGGARGGMVARQVFAIALLSVLVVSARQQWPARVPVFPGAPFALLGLGLNLLLGFRNSACYDRWWEARRQWGELISLTRHLGRQTLILDPISRRRILFLAMAFSHLLADHLRPDTASRHHSRYLAAADRERTCKSRNGPDHLLLTLAADLSKLRAEGCLSEIGFMTLDRTVAGMGLVQAASERLLLTPVPFAYGLLLHRISLLFCLLLPFGFADMLGWATPLATGVIAYALFGLDAIGTELETPFANGPNGMPLRAMADTIEISLLDALGDADLPAQPRPRGYVVM